ncbi:aryl-alcohol oxidase [Flammula alnicola]|nr:aryl-alcohol oxidase [Flammula alnicola]
MSSYLAFVFLLQLLAGSCLGVVFENVNKLPTTEFDFVIVGGGTAGAVLASRLSEIKTLSNVGVLNSEVPYFWANLQNTQYDWNFTTTPQVGLNGRSLAYARGHILGGSSSINAMFYTRGTSDDYDRWARVTGDPGWSWDRMFSYFLKHEKLTQPADHHNITGQYNPAVHGFHGMTSTSLPGFLQSFVPRSIQAANELEGPFEFNLDMNSGKPLGLCWFQGTIGNGTRSSSATSYLVNGVLSRPNLFVVLNSQVTRVLPDKSAGETISFRLVEVFAKLPVILLSSTEGNRSVVRARKEVILSAGSIGTPRILLHSGIGDVNELQSIGIESSLHLPSVGKNLTDHPLLSVTWLANSTDIVDTISTNATALAEFLQQWKDTRTGPLGNSLSSHIIWQRLPNSSSALRTFGDPSAGRNTPHYELAVANGGTSTSGDHIITMGIAVVSPASRGSLILGSNNLLDAPIIDPGLLTAEIDLVSAREAIKSSRQFFAAKAWQGYVLNELAETRNATSDDLLDAYIRQTASTAWHPIGTAAMSAPDAKYGVVDPDLRLKQADGLRVVDASIMPYVIAGHTQTPVYVIAERAADMIKDAWSGAG